ncbi:MAG TPA: sugar ABC transporter permease [Acidimicrobiales bacterium]|jgi:arabinogalactan oligomer/maltooligosaccharide transport system permease protein
MTTVDAPAAAAGRVQRAGERAAVARTARGGTGRWARRVGWRHLVALAAVAFALFPIVWIVSASVNPTGSLTSQRLVPDHPTLDNYRRLFDGSIPYGKWFVNSMVIAGGSAVGITVLSASAAYAFSRMRFRGRRGGILTILLVQMFPQLLAFVAIFVIMTNIKDVFPSIGLGTRAGLMLVYLGGAMGVNTWLMKGFFDTIPIELDESAKVDGATHTQVFVKIILPLVAPILAVVGLLSFILLLNDFILASAVLGQGDPDNFTLSVGLFRFLSDRFNARWGLFAAGALLAGVPVVVLFQFLQRYIVSGLTQGAVKG